jgi:hypothetical protein
MEVQGLERFKRELDTLNATILGFEQNPSEETKLDLHIVRLIADHHKKLIEAAEEGKPFIAGYNAASPEIYKAMDLPWYVLLSTPLLITSESTILEEIDECESVGLESEMCTILRLGIHYVKAGLAPKPTAVVGLLHACDGMGLFHQVILHDKEWRDIPTFSCDPPYLQDARSIEYFAEELKRMVVFLEDHTGRRLDMDRLREVVEESNKQYELWAEYNELRRAVPCPHGWFTGGQQCYAIAQMFQTGDRKGTAWFRELVADAEKRVKEKRSGLPGEERIRMLWFDVFPMVWVNDLMPWLEEEWGVSTVLNMFGYAPYTQIDTTNEERMFKDMAKRNLIDVPMIRQGQGLADTFASDIVRIVRDYSIDCVVWPGHVGHKDGSASIGIMRETCRGLDVPFLHIGLDLFDPRYASVEEVKTKFSQFFTAMGLG